ncbi:12599_t:CDS:2 [Entrophospora sp. SA101]|nr:12599_t:CDS:2 [Entrophospora sp. SA101]
MLRNLRLDLFQSYLSRSYANSTLPPPLLMSLPPPIGRNLQTAIPVKIFVTGFLGFVSLDLCHTWYWNWHNECLITNTIEKGTQPETDVLDDEFVPRPLVVERLKRIFQLYKNQSFYHMVCGEHGTGKTTLTRISAKEVGQGVIYVDVPANFNELDEAFRKAINFTFEEQISFTGQLMRKILGKASDKPKNSEWERALKAFKCAGAVYKAKHNKPSVIIYDNVSQLVYKNPEILDILQNDAKDNADDRKYIAVFVSSEGNVPRRMESKEVGQGVIYVDVPANFNELDEAFRKAINFTFEEQISFTGQLMRKILGKASDKPKNSEWERALKAFKCAGAVYKAKHNKPSVIIYDNVSQLVYKNPEILDILQNDAKDNADDRKYIAVFVSSEGNVPRRMESCSAWSQANKPVMEISDLSEKESKDYLIKRCTIEMKEGNKKNECKIKEEVDELYKLVGGSKGCVLFPFPVVIKQQILREVEKKFKTAQLLRKQPHHEVGKHIISALLDSRELSFTTFMEFFNKTEESDEKTL